MTSSSGRALAASLAVLVAALTCSAADSHSSEGRLRLAVVATNPASRGSSAIDGRVRIEARFRGPTSGTFIASGAISDRGSFNAVRRVAGGRLELTEVLAGEAGTIRIRVVRRCTSRSGTWRVLSGSRAYAGLSGSGAALGGPPCPATKRPARAAYTGTVRTPVPPPPPPLAQPGRFGGGTSQHEEVVFDVERSGRSLAGLRSSITAPCTGPNALSTSRILVAFPESHEIGQDRTFSLRSETRFQTVAVAGRFTSPTTVEGTATASTSVTVTSTNTTYPCSASVRWTASLPPPTAPPGTYCGFSIQGPGICLEVAANGKEVTRFESGVVVRCFPGGVPPSEIEVALTFTGAIPIGGHLGFARRGLPVEGLVSGTASISGVIEPAGTAFGTVGLGAVTLDYEGTRYNCHPAVGRWEARRQG